MADKPVETPRRDGKGDRSRSSLIALASAAVLAVYGAGFDRTRAAAQRFEADGERRRPEPVATRLDSAPLEPFIAHPAVQVAPTPSASPSSPGERASAASTPSAAPNASVAPAADSATKERVDSTVAAAPPKSGVAADSAPSKPDVAPVATPVVANDTTTSDSTRSADSTSAARKQPQWKDGVFSGWGTSRHGDIQATVVIDKGRITYAEITQCLTRYSCSWIERLPGQVVSRQSADVDYVSGATQSTNAFYYAIVDALSKAK